MKNFPHPSELDSFISENILYTISNLMLDIADSVKADLNTQNDNSYTKQCALFGRLHQAFKRELPNICDIKITNPTMEFVFTLGGCECRFDSADKVYAKACKISPMTSSQIEMFPVESQKLVKGIFQICSYKTDQEIDSEYYVIFHGFDLATQKIAEWSSNLTVSALYSLTDEAPESTNIDPAHVEAREESLSQSNQGDEGKQDFGKQDSNG